MKKQNKPEITSLDSLAVEPPVQKPLDADMPEPETKEYVPTVKLQPVFMQLFSMCVASMPYATILTNRNNDKIKLIDIVRFIEQKQNSITAPELEEVLAFIANAPFQYVRPLMEIVDNKDRHNELWMPTQA